MLGVTAVTVARFACSVTRLQAVARERGGAPSASFPARRRRMGPAVQERRPEKIAEVHPGILSLFLQNGPVRAP